MTFYNCEFIYAETLYKKEVPRFVMVTKIGFKYATNRIPAYWL